MTTVPFDSKLSRAISLAGEWPFRALLAAALVVLAATQAMLWSINGLWLDELFTLEATNPALPLSQNFVEVIAPDTNPPLYPILLRIVRYVVADGRLAILVTAAIFLAITLAFVILTSRRAGMPRLGLAVAAAFSICGPVLAFFPEGRAYFLSMCIAFATSWVAALDTMTGRRETKLVAYAVLGGLGSLAHIFGAIFAGSLAAALVGYGILGRRRDLRDAGLVLGGVATTIFAVWFATVQGSLGRVGWIEFTPAAVRDAIWYVRTLTFGPGFMLLPVAAVLALAFFRVRQTRPLLIILGVAFFIFGVLPVAASVIMPMVAGRYWAIGAPAATMLLVFVAWTFLQEHDRVARWAFLATILILAAGSIFGISTARTITLDKPVWRSAPIVAALGQECPPESIRVGKHMYENGITQITGLPRTTFFDASRENVPQRRIADASCPVIGWSEHLHPTADAGMSDAQLLARLQLSGQPDEVDIVRHKTGYVILKAGVCELSASCPR